MRSIIILDVLHQQLYYTAWVD